MEAYVYLHTERGTLPTVLAQLAITQGVRSAVAMVGAWDVLALTDGPDLKTIASTVLGRIHQIEGVTSTLTAPVVPPDRVGIAGWSNPTSPALVRDACYVHIKAQIGAAAGLAEKLSELHDVSGVAVLGGEFDLIVCVAQPWEIASGVILEQIHVLPGIVETSTLVSVNLEDLDDDRDQFSAWV
jgi:DNA-binding Lrp family transcriptional regulator